MSQSIGLSTNNVGDLCDATVASPTATNDFTFPTTLSLPTDQVVSPLEEGVVAAAQKTAGTTRRRESRPEGLKRTPNGRKESNHSKRRCTGSSPILHSINADTIQELDPSLSPQQVNAVLKDYKTARRILNKTIDGKNDTILSVEYLIALINDWRPKSELICMYVRWSKRLRRNYHLDSISTLLCVAKQCEYKPYKFLKGVKTLSITRSTTNYGMNFKFGTCNNKSIDGNKLNEKFLGLSITLRLLQDAVVPGVGAFGNIGLTNTTKRTRVDEEVVLDDGGADHDRRYIVADKPTSRFHTTSGLTGRIWMAIQHRWIALQVVETLFPTQLAMAKCEHESLAFSFQMHASAGPTRFDYLDPIVGICLRYRSTSVIDNHFETLKTVWDDPRYFVPFGNRLLQSIQPKERIQFIVETFQYLYSLVETGKTVVLHKKTEREHRWQMVRGYAFHFWLERGQNEELKASVERSCNKKSIGQRSLSTINKMSTIPKSTRQARPSTPVVPTKTHPSTGCTQSAIRPPGPLGEDNSAQPIGGLLEFLITRDGHDSKGRNDTEAKQGPIIPVRTNATLDAACERDAGHSFYNWDCIRLASQSEISSLLSSHLLIHRDDGVTISAELSPLEVYSADLLYKYRHSRQTGNHNHATILKTNGVVLSVDANVQQFIDVSSKSFHVAREDSSFFKEHGALIPSIVKIRELCKAVFKYGKTDTTRSVSQSRVNIGCGGQHRPSGTPERLIGLNFKNRLLDDEDLNAEEIMHSIGLLTQFTWNIMKDMQDATGDVTLAPDLLRRRQYASYLADYLGMSNDVGFEDVTVVVGLLYPMMPRVMEHVDCMNDSVAGYTRTGAFNAVLRMGGQSRVTLLHLQVICNFRRVIREYLVPKHSLLKSIVANCKLYLDKWQGNMNQVFGGKTDRTPTPLDRNAFYLDDNLFFQEEILISNASMKVQSIRGEYLLTEISPSRVLSFSMFIDPIVDLRDTLCHDQLLELCFIASLLSNPFWFEYTMSSLYKRHYDEQDSFGFGVHPFYDWMKETCRIFGGWQGGPYNRWSPFGGNTPLPNLFGAHPEATKLEIAIGNNRLEQVIQVLHHHLQWVDSLRETQFEAHTPDLSIASVEKHMMTVTDSIYNIVPCQFSAFRLMVFTTICAGCGLTKDGIHLKSLMYPAKGSASLKHLTKPSGNEITRTAALSLCHSNAPGTEICDRQKHMGNVEAYCLDRLMMYVSGELGMPNYLRDETECILCESHPNRNLQCRDWFKKGRRIYDMDKKGHLLQRNYGSNTEWIKMQIPVRVRYAFLTETICYVECDEALKVSAKRLGENLRDGKASYKLCGRGSRTSDYVQEYQNQYMSDASRKFPVIQIRAANFCYGKFVRGLNMTSIQVLGDGEVAICIQEECNDIENCPDGVCFWNNVLNTVYGQTDAHKMYAARYHQQHEESARSSTTLIFPGHLDKGFVERAIFLPLTQRDFFTVLAVPSSWNIQQHKDSDRILQDWMASLPTPEAEAVHLFIQQFVSMARISMKMFDVDVRIFFNTLGSALAFPANRCYHTTIVPSNLSNATNPRDLFIIHTAADTKGLK